MDWDGYYAWREVLLLSSWVKGIAIGLWVPALAAAGASALIKRGMLGWKIIPLLVYVATAATWIWVLESLPSMNTWNPAWTDTSSLSAYSSGVLGSIAVLTTQRAATSDPRRGFDVILKPPA